MSMADATIHYKLHSGAKQIIGCHDVCTVVDDVRGAGCPCCWAWGGPSIPPRLGGFRDRRKSRQVGINKNKNMKKT